MLRRILGENLTVHLHCTQTGEELPAGLMICAKSDERLIIEWIYVAPSYRMQGIGEQLLVAAFDIAKQLTRAKLREALDSLASLEGAAMLYSAADAGAYMDEELSFLISAKGEIRGGILVQCISRNIYETVDDTLVSAGKEQVLCPVYFCAQSVQEEKALLFLADSPSAFLKKKSTAQLREYRQLHQTLRDFAAAGGDIEKEIRMSGVSLKLHQKDSQILQLEIDGKMLTLPANAAIIADSLEADVIGHEEVYGRQRAQEIIDGLKPDEENMADWIRSRKLCLKVLTQKTGKPSDFFNNVPAKQVQTYASNLLAGRMPLTR